ncbi:MAG: hypothetical protein HYR84_06885 [Planctomycetes bacterium]|nr:hypothetical protein [Planctomycetota bacterium]
MSNKKKRSKKMPAYVGWRSELLASLSLARLPDLRVYKITDQEIFDKLVMTERGLCFFVITRGFSSLAARVENADAQDKWMCPLDAATLARVRKHQSPVVFFYFNADTDHGRYLRLDTLPEAGVKELRFPIENTITKASLQTLIREMQAAPKASRAS